MSIPILYYLFPFESYFGNIFFPLIHNYPITFSLLYVLAFSATKQAGGLLFSLAFLTASGIVTKDKIAKSLLVSAIGMAMIFGSIEIRPLQYKILPPYGVVTEAFMPLGSFLLLVGIFLSATSVSKDADLRKKLYRTAESQLSLLKSIGVVQMEKDLIKKYKSMADSTELLETKDDSIYEEENYKEILHDVLNELYSKTKVEKL